MIADDEIYSLWTRTQNILEFSRALIELDREREQHSAARLAKGVHDAAVHAGIIEDGTALTGPVCLMLLDDLARAARSSLKQ